mgnify:FL=1
MMKTRELKRTLEFEGIGVHSGKGVRCRLLPDTSFRGVRFLLPGGPPRLADPFTASTPNSTVLEWKGERVATVEHLLAVLHLLRYRRVMVEVQGGELPILDGSALPYFEALSDPAVFSPGEEEDSGPFPSPLRVQEGEGWAEYSPGGPFRVEYGIRFPHPAIGELTWRGEINEETFGREIAPARTFGFLKQAQELRKRGLALGASLENTIVLDDQGPLSPLRFPDEYVRHKVLDLLGDLFYLGGGLTGVWRVFRGGHSLHLALVRGLLALPSGSLASGAPPSQGGA